MATEVKIRKPAEIVAEYNATVKSLITRIEKKSRKEEEIANLDRLRKRITLLKQTIGDFALISESAPFFIEYSEKILARDEEFFENMDIRAEIIKRKGKVNKEEEFIFPLTDSIRAHYKKATQKEKDDVYLEVKKMFECCVEYQIATSDS